MVVVPPLAHGENRQQPVVAGIVAGDIALAAAHMRQRIDAEGAVEDEARAPEKADDQARPAGNQVAQHGERISRPALMAMQPHQFGIAREVVDLDHVEGVVPAREDPAHMAVDKAGVARRMDVVLGIGMEVMVAVLGRPPQHALLQRALAHESEDKLEDAAGRIGAMGEVAVIAGADRENAEPIQHHAQNDGLPGHAGPDGGETGKMHQHEGDR